MKICIVSSVGGHLTEVRQLRPAYEEYDHFYVLNDRALLPPDMVGKTYTIAHSERDWKFLLNLWEAYRILRRERAKVIISTGAGPVVPFAIVGRLLFGVRVIYVETITKIHAPSLTGKIMKHLADKFYFQWDSLRPFFPNGEFSGPVM
jgi:beta-1,4-N-acetylglucosaminyltransferase